jgi:hypothetical protein
MRRAALNDEDGTGNQRKEAFVVFQHLAELDYCREHVRIIQAQALPHISKPRIRFPKE